DGDDRARTAREGFAARTLVWEGESYVTGFAAGAVVAVDGHRDADDGDFLLTRVELRGENRDELRDERGVDRALASYENRFACVHADVPWRSPHRTARPVIEGSQTATVVGPAGEEIYTDEHGRVKVQFHWDRVGRRDEKSSCFLRVSQAWAGPGWGFVFLPRIGMEVIVTFLEGDPDRPLVTGCVYNGANTPPYTLPDEKTRSTVKSNSSPGGGGYNEIRFEDLAGSEEVFLHAQKDFNEVVEHDHATVVHNDQRNTVDVNHSESVGGDQSLSVSGNRTKTVQKKETNTVNGERHTTVKPLDKLTVNGTMDTAVTGDEEVEVSVDQTVQIARHRTTTITVDDSLDVGGNKDDTVRGEYVVIGGTKVQVNQGGTSLTFEGGHAALSAASYIELKHGSGSIRIEDSGKVKIVAGPELVAGTDGAGFQLKDDKIALGATAIQLIGGGGVMSLDPSGVTMAGAMIKSEATGDNEVAAPIVVII
ncbi:MAG: type VI secretion system tip protein TssI/VgrG, partial [Polyangiales bacterium]